VTQALVGPDLDLATDVGGHLASQVTLDLDVAFEVVTQRDQLVVDEVLDAGGRVNTRRRQRLLDVVRPTPKM
jgi:hypothetical protein